MRQFRRYVLNPLCVCGLKPLQMLESVILRLFRLMDIMMKILGPLLILLAFSLFGMETYCFFFHILPASRLSLANKAALSAVGLFILFNILYNYLHAIFLDPGLPPNGKDSMTPEEASEAAEKGLKSMKECSKCRRAKPPRTHHCSVCKRCVLKMDHHCPWINNCVGFRNYRFFCLFMLWVAIGCIFVVVVYFADFVEVITIPRKSVHDYNARQLIALSFIIGCSITCAMGILGGFHVYLVLTNQTTIEFQGNFGGRADAQRTGEYFRNPYDLGRTRNFQQIFGQSGRLRWMLPGGVSAGDGLSFPTLRKIQI